MRGGGLGPDEMRDRRGGKKRAGICARRKGEEKETQRERPGFCRREETGQGAGENLVENCNSHWRGLWKMMEKNSKYRERRLDLPINPGTKTGWEKGLGENIGDERLSHREVQGGNSVSVV